MTLDQMGNRDRTIIRTSRCTCHPHQSVHMPTGDVEPGPMPGLAVAVKRNAPISVLLFRNIPEHGSRSMERFADEMLAGLQTRPEVRVKETTIRASRLYQNRLLRKLDRYSSLFIRYPHHARRQSADIYHVVDQAYGPLIGSVPAGRTIITCHDLMVLHAEYEDIGFRGSRIGVRRFRWETSFLRRAALVACDSDATASDVTNLLGIDSSRIRVIPLGVSSTFAPMAAHSRAELRSKFDATSRRPLVLHVSTGPGYKNIETTLRVIHALQSKGLDPILLRAGAPLDSQQVALAGKLGLLDLVRELGAVSDKELAQLYGAADVLLFPSHWEGFGWPPVEALACGTPSVVASECRAVVDLVGDAALAGPARDVSALAAAVYQIVTEPELRRALVERGRARVAALTWERTVDAYLEAYQQIASGDSRSPGG